MISMNNHLKNTLLVVSTVLFLNLVFYTAYSNESNSINLSLLLKVLSFKDPLFSFSELQKVLGLTGLSLISTVILIGSLARINKHFVKYKVYEKHLGIASFLVIFLHVLFFFVVSFINYLKLKEIFKDIGYLEFFLKVNSNIALILAWVSFFILLFMFITSFKTLQQRIKNWKKLHKLLYLVLFLVIVRMILIEKGKQIRPFGMLQLYFSIFSFVFLIFSYLLIFWNKVTKKH